MTAVQSLLSMASLTIRNLDEQTKARLRVRAARHNRSMEEEARVMLRQVLAEPDEPKVSLAESVVRRFSALGGFELPLPEREPMRRPPKPSK